MSENYDSTYFAVYRKIIESPVFENPSLLKMWIWFLSKASYRDREIMVGLNVVNLKKGELIFGRKQAALILNINESSVYKYLKWFEKQNMISVKSNNKFSVVSIVNWGVYQNELKKVTTKEQQSNNKVTTTEQQSNTNNKGNKENKDKKVKEIKTLYADKVSLTEEEYQKLIGKFGEATTKQSIEILNNYKISSGKKYKSDYHTILGWPSERAIENQNKSKQNNSYKSRGRQEIIPDYMQPDYIPKENEKGIWSGKSEEEINGELERLLGGGGK